MGCAKEPRRTTAVRTVVNSIASSLERNVVFAERISEYDGVAFVDLPLLVEG